jgi:hypothetical protein
LGAGFCLFQSGSRSSAHDIVFSFNSFLKKIFMPKFLCDLTTIPNMNPMVGVMSHGAEPRGLDGVVGRRGADVAKAQRRDAQRRGLASSTMAPSFEFNPNLL